MLFKINLVCGSYLVYVLQKLHQTSKIYKLIYEYTNQQLYVYEVVLQKTELILWQVEYLLYRLLPLETYKTAISESVSQTSLKRVSFCLCGFFSDNYFVWPSFLQWVIFSNSARPLSFASCSKNYHRSSRNVKNGL